MIKSEGIIVPYLSPHYDARNAKAQFRQAHERDPGGIEGIKWRLLLCALVREECEKR